MNLTLLDIAVYLAGFAAAWGFASLFGLFHGWLIEKYQNDGGPSREAGTASGHQPTRKEYP